jgi:hypothetical protein
LCKLYSPYINHFIQPDTIIPNPANPQSLNRYGYVKNNPVRFNDPTGRIEACDKDDWACQFHWDVPIILPKKDNNNSGKDKNDDFEQNKGCHDLEIDDVHCEQALNWITNGVIGLDTIATMASFFEAAAADLLYIGAISTAIISGGTLSEALILAAYGDYLIAGVAGGFENGLGVTSSVATLVGDYLSGYTRYTSNGLFVGKDTVVSTRNMVLGFTPESNIDLIVSGSQLNYDMKRLNGVEVNESIHISASNIEQIVGQLVFYDSPLEDLIHLFNK